MLLVRTRMVYIVGVVCQELGSIMVKETLLALLLLLLLFLLLLLLLLFLIPSALCELHGNTNLEV